MSRTLVNGCSESIWKSLLVKSLRVGWPHGIEEAAKRLATSTVESLLICGLFEDLFPPQSDLEDCLTEIKLRNYAALCSRETHHGRGLTEAFCSVENEAVAAATEKRSRLLTEGENLNITLPQRSLNCFYTWLKLAPNDVSRKRTLDEAPWVAVPKAIADGHTYEGKKLGTIETLLSGSYCNHAVLGQRVMREGWHRIRSELHAESFSFGRGPSAIKGVVMPSKTVKPKLAGMGVETWQRLLRAFEARETQGWQKGRITYVTDHRDEILTFIAMYEAGGNSVTGEKDTLSRGVSRESMPTLNVIRHRLTTLPKPTMKQHDLMNATNDLHQIGRIQIKRFRDLKQRWRYEGLGPKWMKKYPFLFDVDPEWDRALFYNQGVVYGRHFNEWLASLVLYYVTDFHALNQKYQFKKHKNKRKILESLCMTDSLRELIDRRGNGAQCPDLLMYDPNDPSKWFFCEVKGPGDRLQPNQLDLFRRLGVTGEKRVCVLSIEDAESLVHPISEVAPEFTASDAELNQIAAQLAIYKSQE
jgi:hypothetical protein